MKNFLIVVLMAASLVGTGCGVYGNGSATGYVHAVDDGIAWDNVWVKTSLDSSDSDCYLISPESELKDDLLSLPPDSRVRIEYRRHIITLGICPEGTGTEDEITGFSVVTE